jgi:probable 2-oxoglutarate dehydrogenase E1 component DHKTD1
VSLPFLPSHIVLEPPFQSDGIITPAEAQSVRDTARASLDAEVSKVDTYVPNAPMLQGQWKDIVWPADETAEHDPSTGVARNVLEKVGHASVTVPSGFVRPFLPTSRTSVDR